MVKKSPRFPVVLTIVLGSALLLSFVQMIIIFRERHFGFLAGLIAWDDNIIIRRGLDRLPILTNSTSMIEISANWRALSPHAPIADVQTDLGLLLFNGDIAGPYALNFLWVVLAIGLTVVALNKNNPWLLTAVVMVIIFQSLAFDILTVIKSDTKSSVFIACGMLVAADNLCQPRFGKQIALASLFALATLCKLTAFYIPIFLVTLLIAFEIVNLVSRWESQAERRDPFSLIAAIAAMDRRDLARIAVQIAIVLVPFTLGFAWSAKGDSHLIGYMRMALGPQWVDNLNMAQRAQLYLPGGQAVWGMSGWLLAVTVPIALFQAVRNRSVATVLMIAVCLGATVLLMVPLLVAKTSNPEFGSYFIGSAFGTALVCFYFIFCRAEMGRTPIAICLAAVFAVSTVLTVPFKKTEPTIAARASYDVIVDNIISAERRVKPTVAFMFEDSVAGYPNIALLHYLKTGRTVGMYRIDNFTAKEIFQRSLRDTDFVVTLVPGVAGQPVGYKLSRRFETTRDLLRGDRAVSETANMIKIAVVPWKGGSVNLYRNQTLTAP